MRFVATLSLNNSFFAKYRLRYELLFGDDPPESEGREEKGQSTLEKLAEKKLGYGKLE